MSNGVMFQFFHWFLERDAEILGGKPLWVFLAKQAGHLKDIGVDAVWLPPVYKGASGLDSNGYDVFDHYDLGEFDQEEETEIKGIRTRYGTKEELHNAINALHGYKMVNGSLKKIEGAKYIQVYGDIVLNHKMGGKEEDYYWYAVRVEKGDRAVERWGKGYERGPIKVKAFTKYELIKDPKRQRYSDFKWNVRHFDGVDTIVEIDQSGAVFNDPNGKYLYRFLYNELGYDPGLKSWDEWVSLEKSNYDYLMGDDLDFGRWEVREEMKKWGEWLTKEIGLDGFRLDAVKHINADYIREWLGHVRARTGKELFTVGEYLDKSNTNPLHSFISRVTACGEYPQNISLFDFPLREKFRKISWWGDAIDLRWLSYGTLISEQPTVAVTFVCCHDDEWGRSVDSHINEWFRPLAYAYILLRQPGYPCIFFPDYYGSKDSGEHHKGYPERKDYLQLLLKLRKQFALGEERYYEKRNIVGWVRMGGVYGAKGAMAVTMNTTTSVQALRMDTGRANRRFYHFATIKDGGATIVYHRYDMYGDKAEGLYTDSSGWADFLADAGSVAIWIEDGVGIE